MMIKRLMIFLAAILIPMVLVACTGSNPQSTASIGTLAWIDAPLNGSTLPLGPINIVSHSSDATGITQVELSVNGTVVKIDQNQDASQHLVVMNQMWTPTASGNYQLFVRAQNSNGGWSNYAQAAITINGAPAPTQVPNVQQPTPTLFVPSPTPAQTGCVGVPAIASFYSSTPAISAGDSVTLIWDAIINADSIEIDNGIGSVGPSGSRTVSPASTTTYTLIARCGDQLATSQVPIRVTQPVPTASPTTSPTNPTIGAPTFSTNQFWYGLVGCGDM
ncbi:MAG TPA: Ig-like domain-containing protein, partial [Anaerolineae bacterium]|nr:Ig-like domain-containing protein [Anaerolineae bacterium]